MPNPSEPKKSWRSGAIELKTVPSLPPSNAVIPIAITSSATRPRTGGEPDRAGHRQPREQHALAAVQRREAREQAEVDAERVGVARPRLDAVEAHAHERDHEVEQREDRQRLRLAPLRPAQLDDAEEEDPGRRRPPAQARGVLERLGGRDARDDPADHAPDRPPRAEQAEDVAEQQRRERHAHPQDHEDHRGREVVLLGVGARQPGVDDGGERDDAHHAEQHVDHQREPEQPPLARLLQARARPQRGERDERDDQHGGRSGREEPLGDRQVGAADQAVGEHGEEHGLQHVSERRRPRRGGAVIPSGVCLAG